MGAAEAMVNAYGMQSLGVAPALNSKHVAGLAIDMSISWAGTLSIKKASGTMVAIASAPKTGMNADLHIVSASFGVMKYNGGGVERPLRSDTGN